MGRAARALLILAVILASASALQSCRSAATIIGQIGKQAPRQADDFLQRSNTEANRRLLRTIAEGDETRVAKLLLEDASDGTDDTLRYASLDTVVSKGGVSVSRYLDEEVEATTAMYVAAPRNTDQYAKTFGAEPSAAQWAQVTSELATLRSLPHVTFARAKAEANEFANFLASTDTSYVTIIGHNDGGMFALPSGIKMDLTSMAAQCSRLARRCIFLSCESVQYLAGQAVGITSAISYGEAGRIATELVARMTKAPGGVISLTDIAAAMPAMVKRSNPLVRPKVAVMFGIGSVPLMIIGASSLPGEEMTETAVQ